MTQISPSRTRERTPRVAATVRDDRAELTQNDITFAHEGRDQNTSAYDAGTCRSTFDSGRLSLARHTVKITATDAAGNTAMQTRSSR